MEQIAKERFKADPNFRSAVLSMIYRACPPGPPSLIDTWYACKKIATHLDVKDTEIYDNVAVEIKLRGPVSLIHTCDALCEVRTSWNSEKQDRLKKELETLGPVYKGSFKLVLEKLKEVFPISYRC